jgi:hypothetical protein
MSRILCKTGKMSHMRSRIGFMRSKIGCMIKRIGCSGQNWQMNQQNMLSKKL